MKFSDRLKELREEKGLTQKEFATILNINRATVAGYESQGKEPNFDRLKEFATFFDVSVDYLVGFSDVREKVIETSCTHSHFFRKGKVECMVILKRKGKVFMNSKRHVQNTGPLQQFQFVSAFRI